MSLIKLTCPSCGAQIHFDNDKDSCFCTYCGTKIMQEKIIVEHKGKIEIDGISGEQAFLDRGFIFLEDRDFSRASDYFEKVLDLNPKCSKAYLGKLMCQLKCDRIYNLKKYAKKPLSDYDDFLRAKKYADSDELEKLLLIDNTVKDSIMEKLESQITESEKRINMLNQYINKNSKNYNSNSYKSLFEGQYGCGFWLMVLLGIISVFSTIGIVIFAQEKDITGLIVTFLFMIVPILSFVYLVRKNSWFNKFKNEYQLNEKSLNEEMQKLHDLQYELSVWKSYQNKNL